LFGTIVKQGIAKIEYGHFFNRIIQPKRPAPKFAEQAGSVLG
jgi:hypothetical protein